MGARVPRDTSGDVPASGAAPSGGGGAGGAGTASARPERGSRLSENRRWLIGTAVAVAFGGGLVAPVDVVGLWRERGVTAAERVQSCMAQHDLDRARQVTREDYSTAHWQRTGEYGRITFAECVWPPAQGSSADGYSEVSAVFADGPLETEASSANGIDRISATCEEVELGYTTGSQGASERLPHYRVRRGDVVTAWTGEPWTGPSPYPYPERDEIVVVRNSKVLLDTASCVA